MQSKTMTRSIRAQKNYFVHRPLNFVLSLSRLQALQDIDPACGIHMLKCNEAELGRDENRGSGEFFVKNEFSVSSENYGSFQRKMKI